jgi:hypothetical protein
MLVIVYPWLKKGGRELSRRANPSIRRGQARRRSGDCVPSCGASTTVATGASVTIDGGLDATPSGEGNDAEVAATADTGSDVAATDAMTTFDGTAADAAPDTGIVFTQCHESSTCASGTVAEPDCLP